jgi:hypothetical protein
MPSVQTRSLPSPLRASALLTAIPATLAIAAPPFASAAESPAYIEDAFVCSCHGSVFDPRDDADVLDGPAPRRLPALSLKIIDGAVVVASGFIGRVGGTQS